MLGTTWKTICHAHWPGCAGVCTGWWAWRTSWCSDCRQRSSLLRCSLPSPSPWTPPHLHEENGTTQTTVFIALMARNDCHATDFSEERHSEQSWEGWELVAALGLRVRHKYYQPAVYDHSPTVFGLSSICRPPSMMVVCTYPVVEVKCKCDCFQFPCHFSSHIGIPSSSVDLECATFSCVQIMVWLSLLGIFSICTDVTACDCCKRVWTESWFGGKPAPAVHWTWHSTDWMCWLSVRSQLVTTELHSRPVYPSVFEWVNIWKAKMNGLLLLKMGGHKPEY